MDWVTVIATGIAALAGGAGAYLVDWGKRAAEQARDREQREAGALLRAGLNLFHIDGLLTSARRQFVIPVVMRPDEKLVHGEFHETPAPEIRFDLDALGFLMGTDDETLLALLLDQESYLRNLWPMLSKWSRQHREWVAPHAAKYIQPAFQPGESANSRPQDVNVDLAGLRAAVGRDNAWRMEALAEEIVSSIEAQLEALPRTQAMIRKILRERYPDRQIKKMIVPPYEPLRDVIFKVAGKTKASAP